MWVVVYQLSPLFFSELSSFLFCRTSVRATYFPAALSHIAEVVFEIPALSDDWQGRNCTIGSAFCDAIFQTLSQQCVLRNHI